MEIIKKDFGSLESMQDKVNAAAVAVQGSGWGWLAYDKVMNRLQVAVTMNQDVLESTTGIAYFTYMLPVYLSKQYGSRL